tara:strand:+ start:1742 stop:2380 length:639 start_codon:yes stop_codon:yes gene_type:complete
MDDQYIDMFLPPPLGVTQFPGDINYIQKVCKELEFQRNSCNSITIDNYLLNKPELIDLKTYIGDFVHRYTRTVFHSNQEIDITQSWVNITDSGEEHPKHQHPNSYMSGVMFVKSCNDSPPLLIENYLRPQYSFVDLYDGGRLDNSDVPPNKYISTNTPIYPVMPVQGNIVLFSSPTPHMVPKNNSKEERITLAFNTYPKRPFGSERDVTYVY